MSNPMSIQELVAQNLAPPAEPPAEEIPMEAGPGAEFEDDGGPGIEELLEDPAAQMAEPSAQPTDDELRAQARAFLRSQGEMAGSPDEILQLVSAMQMQQQAAPQGEPEDPMAYIGNLTQGIQRYDGDGDFDDQAAYIAAQVAQRATQDTMGQIMEQVKAELQQALAPIMQAVQTAQLSQAEQEVRADLRSLNLDDQAIDATIQHMQKMGPQAITTYLQQDVFRETMQGFAQSKKRNTRADELQRRQAEAPVDAIPAARDANPAASSKAPTSIKESVAMALADPNYGRN